MTDPLNVTDNSSNYGGAPEFGGKLVEPQAYEDQNLLEDTGQFINNNAKKDEPPKSSLQPMSPLAASSVVVNLLLATGPFT